MHKCCNNWNALYVNKLEHFKCLKLLITLKLCHKTKHDTLPMDSFHTYKMHVISKQKTILTLNIQYQ